MKLKTRHGFKLIQMMRQAEIKAEISEILELAMGLDGDNGEEKVGALLFSTIFNLFGHPAVESGMYSLLADLTGKKEADIKEQLISETAEQIKELISQNKSEIMSFFKPAAPTV